MADHSARIAEIQNLLRTGVTEVTVDGVVTKFSPASLRKELRELMGEDDIHAGRKPAARNIYLGGW